MVILELIVRIQIFKHRQNQRKLNTVGIVNRVVYNIRDNIN